MGDGRVDIEYVIQRLTEIVLAEDKMLKTIEFKRELAKVLEGYKQNGN
jgi:hypothetical protein